MVNADSVQAESINRLAAATQEVTGDMPSPTFVAVPIRPLEERVARLEADNEVLRTFVRELFGARPEDGRLAPSFAGARTLHACQRLWDALAKE